MIDHRIWTALTNLVLVQGPVRADAITSHGWGDLHDETIAHVASQYAASGARYVILNGAPAYEEGAPGFEYWRQRLIEQYGVPSEVIYNAGLGKNTAEEATAFVQAAKTLGITSTLLISVPQHIIRAFLTNLAVMQAASASHTIVPRTALPVAWTDPVTIRNLVGDIENTSRLGRFAAEIARCIEYRQRFEEGDAAFPIASAPEGLHYLQGALENV